MIVEIQVFLLKVKTPMRVEYRFEPMVWELGNIGTSTSYKKGIEEMPGYDEISEELLHSARAIIEADNEMQRQRQNWYVPRNLGEN